jgi:hypothetical protein
MISPNLKDRILASDLHTSEMTSHLCPVVGADLRVRLLCPPDLLYNHIVQPSMRGRHA